MASGFTYKFGKNKEGKAIRSRNGGPWHIMVGVKPADVKKAIETVWDYRGNNEGKTLKEICAIDAEYLDMMISLMHADSRCIPEAKLLLGRK